ncbi:MAG: type II toxin-antitoxin system VapC family toxin [Chloroflexi bacterium]|nr:type II toxin-antitoxin system VapC family toxin [Chloroflexota bacterium]
MKLLDTNIVVYAFGGPHPYRDPCRRLFEDIARGNSGYQIDVALLQEVLYVYSYRAERAHALELFDRLLKIFPDPLPFREAEVRKARELLGKYGRLSPRDAVHLAVALAQDVEAVVTADEDMFQVSEVTCYKPSDIYP